MFETDLQNGLLQLGLSADGFAMLAGCSQSRLSRAFRQVAPFSGPETIAFSKLLNELEEIGQDTAPLVLDFKRLDTGSTGANPKITDGLTARISQNTQNAQNAQTDQVQNEEEIVL